jgi:hypothetical protein
MGISICPYCATWLKQERVVACPACERTLPERAAEDGDITTEPTDEDTPAEEGPPPEFDIRVPDKDVQGLTPRLVVERTFLVVAVGGNTLSVLGAILGRNPLALVGILGSVAVGACVAVGVGLLYSSVNILYDALAGNDPRRVLKHGRRKRAAPAPAGETPAAEERIQAGQGAIKDDQQDVLATMGSPEDEPRPEQKELQPEAENALAQRVIFGCVMCGAVAFVLWWPPHIGRILGGALCVGLPVGSVLAPLVVRWSRRPAKGE